MFENELSGWIDHAWQTDLRHSSHTRDAGRVVRSRPVSDKLCHETDRIKPTPRPQIACDHAVPEFARMWRRDRPVRQ